MRDQEEDPWVFPFTCDCDNGVDKGAELLDAEEDNLTEDDGAVV